MTDKSLKEKYMQSFKSCDFKRAEEKGLNLVKYAGIEGIVDAYGDWLKGFSSKTPVDEIYEIALGMVDRMGYAPEGVVKFCSSIGNKEVVKISDDYASIMQVSGIYVSALVNGIIQSNETIRIKPNTALSWLGFMHKSGELIVEGDAGNFIGRSMSGGKLTVKGSVLDELGYRMEGGLLYVEGNAKDYAGDEMESGEILVCGSAGHYSGVNMNGGEAIIMGNAGKHAGSGMKGGKLVVMKKIKSLGISILGGEIWENNKLIWQK